MNVQYEVSSMLSLLPESDDLESAKQSALFLAVLESVPLIGGISKILSSQKDCEKDVVFKQKLISFLLELWEIVKRNEVAINEVLSLGDVAKLFEKVASLGAKIDGFEESLRALSEEDSARCINDAFSPHVRPISSNAVATGGQSSVMNKPVNKLHVDVTVINQGGQLIVSESADQQVDSAVSKTRSTLVEENSDKLKPNIIETERQMVTNVKKPKERRSRGLSEDIKTYLEDTEIIFKHKRKEEILLKDLYVFPDMKVVNEHSEKISPLLNASFLLENLEESKSILILGSEQSGKTALAKMLTTRILEKGLTPLICDGRRLKRTCFEELKSDLARSHYGEKAEEWLEEEKEKLVLIIDDYDKNKINIRFHKKLLESIESSVASVILLSNTSIRYEEKKYLDLSEYEQFELLTFGNVKRSELIDKWNSIGVVETIDTRDLHRKNDEMRRHVDSVVRVNIVPSKPLYILTIIQMLESMSSSDFSLSSYGHCYQSIIQSNLESVSIGHKEIDVYVNYLTEFANFLLCSGLDSASEDELARFQDLYSESFLVKSHDEVVDKLLQSGIIKEDLGDFSFRYRYIFYFYAAKYLSDNLATEDVKKVISNICDNLHTEKSANILIFLMHHSRAEYIIDEVLLRSYLLFEGRHESKLDKVETNYLLEYFSEIPALVVERKDIEEERSRRLHEKDKFEMEASEDSEEISEEEDEEARELLSNVNGSARIVEIVGQILRNRHGSLNKKQLSDLCDGAYEAGLKFLNFFLEATREEQEQIVSYIEEVLRSGENFTELEISKKAGRVFLMLCYGISFVVIKKITNSLGTEVLMPIFEEIHVRKENTPARDLIYLAIKIDFERRLPKKELERTYARFSGNPMARRLLKDIVREHVYLNHVDYKDRQWISDKLNLPVDTQRVLQGVKSVKK